MKKLSITTHISLIAGEIVVLICSILLMPVSIYLWIPVGISCVAFIITLYSMTAKLSIYISEKNASYTTLESKRSEKTDEFRERLMTSVAENNEQLSKKITELFEMQEKLINENSEMFVKLENIIEDLRNENSQNIKSIGDSVNDLTEAMEKNNENNGALFGKAVSDMKAAFDTGVSDLDKSMATYLSNQKSSINENIEHIRHSNEIVGDNITSLTKTLGDNSLKQTESYYEMLKEVSERHKSQINEMHDETAKMLEVVKNAILNVIDTSDKRTSEMNAASEKVVKNSVKEISSLMSTVKTESEKRIEQIEAENTELLGSVRILLNDTMSRISQDLIGSNQKYCKDMSECLIGFSNDSSEKMINSYKDAMSGSAEVIAKNNEQFNEKHAKMIGKSITDFSEMYDKTIQRHMEQLREEVTRRITDFTEANRSVTEEHNTLTRNLLNSEDKFIGELSENNLQLRSTINKAFEEYSRSVSGNISDLESKLSDNMDACSNLNQKYITDITDHNEALINSFAEKLSIYSDSLVDRSAEAVGHVQAENNRELQRLSSGITELAEKNKNFIDNCNTINTHTHEKIDRLINDRAAFVSDLEKLSEKNISAIDQTMDKKIDVMSEKLDKLNIANSNRFSTSMDNYREKFVTANAVAIANAQKDTMDSIVGSEEKIAALSEYMTKTQEDIVKTRNDLTGSIRLIKETINNGIEKTMGNSNEFHDEINNTVDEKLKMYNETFEDLVTEMTKIAYICKSNTEKYDETLNMILSSQREANSLSEKDINLLEKLMSR